MLQERQFTEEVSAIQLDFRGDGAKSPEIPQKEGVLGSEIAARNRKIASDFPSHP